VIKSIDLNETGARIFDFDDNEKRDGQGQRKFSAGRSRTASLYAV
jgi:hypothetical protein